MGAVREGKPTTESRAMGTVTGHKHRRRPGMDGSSVLVHPVVKFEAEDGRTIEFESKLGSNIPPKVGESVEVFYDPSRPEEARITVGSALRLTKWHFIIVAAIFAVPAVLFFMFFLLMIVISFV
ncbi:MAG: DUF3592 domain-containing protein [Actinomycetota bacterium]|jgi:hypothetical protein|nr:DUF3592 domain-containing protein [Actinomycetota bacterium]